MNFACLVVAMLGYNAKAHGACIQKFFAMIKSLLMVCTGNICRSPMAEALFKQRAKKLGLDLKVGSAGVAALVGHAAAAQVIDLMHSRGLDLSGHRARQLTTELGREHDLILVMEQGHRRFIMRNWPELAGRVRRLGEFRGEDVADPYQLPDKVYAHCLDVIEGCMDDWVEVLFA